MPETISNAISNSNQSPSVRTSRRFNLISAFLAFLLGLFAGAIIASAGFFGDVVISCVKRDLQIKDSGQLIPGHGGILVRLDSLLYTAPLFFHYVKYLCY